MLKIAATLILGCLAVVLTTADISTAQVFVVNTNGDLADVNPGNGVCSTGVPAPNTPAPPAPECTLRAAIEEANATAGPNSIAFLMRNPAGAVQDCNIDDGPCTIQPGSALPAITETLVISGVTQPNATCGTDVLARNLLIAIDGTNAGAGVHGLEIDANGVVIRGLTINNFGGAGIDAELSAEDNVIQCNYIGTNRTGTLAAGNFIGVDHGGARLIVGSDANGVADPYEWNLVSGNDSTGIDANGSDAVISSNLIGVDAAITTTIPNGGWGLVGPAVGTIGSIASTGNVVGGNGLGGIYVFGGSFSPNGGVVMHRNFVGTDSTGMLDFGNNGPGILRRGGSPDADTIGAGQGQAIVPSLANMIAFNAGAGIAVTSNFTGDGGPVSIRGNAIYANDGLGIDLGDDGPTANDDADVDGGDNNLMNFPELITAVLVGDSVYIRYDVRALTFSVTKPIDVDFYLADRDQEEGQEYLGTDTTSIVSCIGIACNYAVLPAGELVIGDSLLATATDADGNTSEFSPPIEIVPRNLVVDWTGDSSDDNPGDGVCYVGQIPQPCTLRAAIEEANAISGPDSISFKILPALLANNCGDNSAGSPCTITPSSALPNVTDTTYILGETQLGATCGTSIADHNLRIILDGTNAGSADGIKFGNAGRGRVSGLVIQNFEQHGIETAAAGLHVACNYIGTSRDGMSAAANLAGGILISSNGTDTRIGTDGDGIDDEEEGNVISGNGGMGIEVNGAGSTIAGNIIGLAADTTTGLGNADLGIEVTSGNVIIGTDEDAVSDSFEANVIAGNDGAGIFFVGNQATDGIVAGNYIGTNPASLPLPNGGPGIETASCGGGGICIIGSLSLDLRVGSTMPGGRNVIAHNAGDGVFVQAAVRKVTILGNSIFSNGGQGIDLGNVAGNDTDDADIEVGNDGQNTPDSLTVLQMESDLAVSYLVDSDPANSSYPIRIEFFEADSDQQEGERFLGFDEYTEDDYNGCGTAPCLKDLTIVGSWLVQGDTLVATATDDAGNTSEFSAPVEVTAPAEGPGASIRVRAFLEGPFITSSNQMSTLLLDGGQLPLDQPFSNAIFDGTALDFDSTQSVVSHPDSTVEWLVASLRTGTGAGTEVVGSEQAVVIYESGRVASTGSDSLHFPDVADGSYYLVLRSRNHLDIMSATAISVSGGMGSYDFTTALSQAFDNGQRQLKPGIFGMAAGDGSIDGQITAADFNDWLADTKAGATGYLQTDFDLDGQVIASDFNLWLTNTKAGAASKVP